MFDVKSHFHREIGLTTPVLLVLCGVKELKIVRASYSVIIGPSTAPHIIIARKSLGGENDKKESISCPDVIKCNLSELSLRLHQFHINLLINCCLIVYKQACKHFGGHEKFYWINLINGKSETKPLNLKSLTNITNIQMIFFSFSIYLWGA